VADELLDAQGLERERHVHHRRRMALGRSEVHDAAAREQVQAAVAEVVLLDERADLAHAAGRAEGVSLEDGVYAGLIGPQYETPAEVRMLRGLGADSVGMSTVLECIAARWAGLKVCGVSLVTNAGAGYTGKLLTHEEVLAAGTEAGPRLARVIRRFLADLPAD